jgi:predicted nucleic acid-binding protein
VKTVFVDSSAFYAVLTTTDPFYPRARALFEQAEREHWTLLTTNYVVHETWALLQTRMGWKAVDDFLDVFLPLCRVEFVDPVLHAAGVARCRQAHLRELSLTDCISFEFMKQRGLTEAIVNDAHFAREQIKLP